MFTSNSLHMKQLIYVYIKQFIDRQYSYLGHIVEVT